MPSDIRKYETIMKLDEWKAEIRENVRCEVEKMQLNNYKITLTANFENVEQSEMEWMTSTDTEFVKKKKEHKHKMKN